ncbi:YjzC family protein [Oceanobacillus saliphilus]|uniref:YjzC family protein n=1 Tax=Oceanobacillus saliphilus TaxID=2925834 RepID=UPI00201DE64D|nr:YjzC family protein [Oceanobacillus saliphilus]
MGEGSQFRSGDKAPNNGVYIEIGETGSNVNDPQQIKLHAGEKFPDNTNQNRIWVNKRKQHEPGVQGRQN